MIMIEKTHLRKFNYTHDIMLHYVRFECVNFHQVCVFPYNILVLVIDGNADHANYIDCRESGQTMQLEPMHYFFVPAGLSAEYKLTPSVRYLTFHVGLEIYPGIELFAGTPSCLSAHSPEFVREVRDIFDDADDHRAVCRLKRSLMGFFLEHWPEHFSERSIRLGKCESLLKHIAAHCTARLTVESLAEYERITPEAFSRRFSSNIGMAPKHFINKMLLGRVLALLNSPDLSLKDIADRLEFSSEFYLSRFVKKYIGIAPREYRNAFRTQKKAEPF